jgi:hypothetical protein
LQFSIIYEEAQYLDKAQKKGENGEVVIGGWREEKWVEKGREVGRKGERWVRIEKRVYGGG